jgi:hypothetical protein
MSRAAFEMLDGWVCVAAPTYVAPQRPAPSPEPNRDDLLTVLEAIDYLFPATRPAILARTGLSLQAACEALADGLRDGLLVRRAGRYDLTGAGVAMVRRGAA